MEAEDLVEELKKRLPKENFDWQFDRRADKLRIVHHTLHKGMDISLPEILSKYEQKKERAIDEVVYTVRETFLAMEQEQAKGFAGENTIYPVIRSTSFPTESSAGQAFLTKDHTAETRIFYALDLGNTYRLIDHGMLSDLQMTEQEIQEVAMFKVKALPTAYKQDIVSDNIFYFINNNDGYDASRILNQPFMKEMEQKIEGHMVVSVPHQDVLIIGDIRNDTGYDVVAQIAMQFFTTGAVPVTSLSFIYEDGKLEPIFIMAKNRLARREKKK
ncbi:MULTISPECIES: DUF1444 family protein [Sporosarcina]|uniref:DUF1444 domain-containing protein n=1 Tax=Sporosarcina ureae TaxID=1571 RepID=A0ABN4YNG0_SPOUR|nr:MULTISPECIES: DUF1444 family protein [Sporosarcina]ARF13302.1 hypothetical protein SporoS204_03365 [Sporosarcina ureae]PIC77697.1 DUF1444 domain-containing protein [Sporosarcina sp. P19]